MYSSPTSQVCCSNCLPGGGNVLPGDSGGDGNGNGNGNGNGRVGGTNDSDFGDIILVKVVINVMEEVVVNAINLVACYAVLLLYQLRA